jgi:DNA modification methylase
VGDVVQVNLFNGDCLEVIKQIPDKSIDLVVIDPPYEKKGNGYYCGGGAFGSTNRKYHSDLDDNNLLNGVDNVCLDELMRVMKKVNIYIWCNKEQLLQYMEYFKDYNLELLTWHKTNPVPTCNNKYLSDTEYLLFFREKGVKIYGSYATKRKYYVSPTNKADKDEYGHPTIKPLEIIQNLIINSSNEGDTVLDCFMGSGTTGVACINTGRNFIGMELDEQYFTIAQDRINKAKSSWLDNLLGGVE